MAVAIHHDHVVRRNRMVPHHLVRGRGAVGDEEAMIGVEDAGRVAFRCADGPVVIEQLPQFLDRIAHIGAQHVFAVELVIHLPDGRFQKGDATRMARTVPRVGAVFGIIEQGFEERRLNAFQVGLGLADDVTGDELRGILEHVDETVQLAQDVVRQVSARLGFAVDVDRHIVVLPAHFLDEVAQVHHRRIEIGTGAELFVVDRQDKGAGA